MANPSASTVYNNAAAMRTDPRTPGLNSFLAAWAQLQNFTGGNALSAYNVIAGNAIQIGQLQR